MRPSRVGYTPAKKSVAVGIYGVMALFFGFAAVGIGITTSSAYANGIETSATVIKAGPARGEATIEFRTRDGRLIRTGIEGTAVGRTGDTSRIRYSADDPTNVVGAGRENSVVNILTSLAFAFIAIHAAAMTYRRMRDRPRIEATS